MAVASGVTLEIEAARVEFLPGALEYSRQGALPGGLKNNREYAACAVEMAAALPVEVENLLYDPQTSGGLLIALPEDQAGRFERGWRIGRVLPRRERPIRIV
jgi:selenide,water dikinase